MRNPTALRCGRRIGSLTWPTLLLVACASLPHSPNAAAAEQPPPAALVTPVASPQVEFAKSHKSFYTRLVVKDLRTDQASAKCVDQSVLSWIRKVFAKDSRSIAFTATITDPVGNAPITVPLYASSKDEAANPPTCSTSAIGSTQDGFPITPFYVADLNSPFKLNVSLKINETTNVSAAAQTISIANTVLTYTGANGALIKTLGGAPISAATAAIDASLSANYSSSNTISTNLAITPIPRGAGDVVTDTEWTNFKDGLQFGSPVIESSVWGVSVGDGIKPNFEIIPQDQGSLLGDGPGHYVPVVEILGQRLVPAGQGTLREKLLVGIGGLNTKTSLQITDPKVLDDFCTSSLNLFTSFLTYDDALAAQFALLSESTAFFGTQALRAAPHCLPADQQTELASLSANFVLPSLLPAVNSGRDATVAARTTAVARGILNAKSQPALLKIINDPASFILSFGADIVSAFPARTDGKPLGSFVGNDAIAELANTGVYELACGRASPGQSLRTIVAVVHDSASTTPIAAIMTFANADPPAGQSADADPPTLIGLSFYSVPIAIKLTQVTLTPTDCPLLPPI